MPPEIKVLHVVAGVSLTSGGPTSALMAILGMLSSSSVRCSVAVGIAGPPDEPMLRRIGSLAPEVHGWPREKFSRFGYSRGFSRDIGGLVRSCDIVHIHSFWNWPCYAAARAARRAGVPVVFRPAGALDEFDVRKHAAAKAIIGPLWLRRLFEAPNVFHCTARREAEKLVTYGGSARREVLFLPVAPLGRPDAAMRDEVRRRLRIPAGAPVVLFMSRINYKKGLEYLLPALAAARRQIPDLHFILAGESDDGTGLMADRLIEQHGLGKWTRKLGFVGGDDKTAILAASDLFALPSRNENFGVSVVEALAAGVPALVSPDVYIWNDIAGEGVVEICERSIAGVTGGILGMLRRREGGETPAAARRLWERHFSPERLRSRYEEFYTSVAAARTRP